MKSNNYLVTYTDLSTMGLLAKGSPSTGNRIATKQFINNNYYVDSGPLAGYANNQCPPYQYITNTTFFNASVNYGSTSDIACYSPVGSIIVLGNSSTYCTSTTFTSSGFVTFANGNYFLSYGGNTININISGAPTNIATMYGGGCTACTSTTTTTTTIPPSRILTCFSLSNNTSYFDGCNGSVDEQQVYTVTLKDQYGSPIAAPYTITFEFSYDFANIEDNPLCESSGTAYATLNVNSGNTTGQYTFYTLSHAYCCESGICNGSCYSYQNNITYLSNSAGLSLC
jgi:hypothetical protein